MNPSLHGNKVEKTFLSSPCSTRTRIIFIIQLISLVSLLLIFVGCLNFSLTIGYYDANDADRDRNIRLRGLEISHRPPVDIQIYHHNIDFPPATNNDSTSENTSNSSATVAPQKLSSIQNSTYNLNPRYLEYLKNRLPPFPKKLHILFPHKEYYRAVHPPLPFVQNSVLRFMERNPNWNVTVHDDRDVDSLIDKAARDDIISWEERNILVGNGSDSFPGAHPVERGDLARMLLMWYEGGMYVDVDSLINRNFDEVFTAGIKMCISIFSTENFSQSIVCSSPNNKLFLEIIRAMSNRRMTGGPNGGPLERRGGWAKGGDLFSMGPPIYNRFVLRRLFGKTDYVRGYVPYIEEAKKALVEGATDTIAVGQWKSPCDSFLVEPFEGCWYLDRTELYAMYNISRWGAAVQKRWEDQAFMTHRDSDDDG